MSMAKGVVEGKKEEEEKTKWL